MRYALWVPFARVRSSLSLSLTLTNFAKFEMLHGMQHASGMLHVESMRQMPDAACGHTPLITRKSTAFPPFRSVGRSFLPSRRIELQTTLSRRS